MPQNLHVLRCLDCSLYQISVKSVLQPGQKFSSFFSWFPYSVYVDSNFVKRLFGQVHIVKHSSCTWKCKICHAKQPVQQVFGEGSGAQCRSIVQKLNLAQGQSEELKKFNTSEGSSHQLTSSFLTTTGNC